MTSRPPCHSLRAISAICASSTTVTRRWNFRWGTPVGKMCCRRGPRGRFPSSGRSSSRQPTPRRDPLGPVRQRCSRLLFLALPQAKRTVFLDGPGISIGLLRPPISEKPQIGPPGLVGLHIPATDSGPPGVGVCWCCAMGMHYSASLQMWPSPYNCSYTRKKPGFVSTVSGVSSRYRWWGSPRPGFRTSGRCRWRIGMSCSGIHSAPLDSNMANMVVWLGGRWGGKIHAPVLPGGHAKIGLSCLSLPLPSDVSIVG